MAWIEFHPARIKRLQKFSDFRRELQLSVHEAIGFLGSFWGEVIELAETGDVSGWSPAYACEVVGSGLNPDRVWNALVKHRWIDETPEGKKLIHDWLDTAGRYLIGKYAKDNRSRLTEIWAIHGRIYGSQVNPKDIPSVSQQNPKGLPRTASGRGKGKGRGSSDQVEEEDPGKGGLGENHKQLFDNARQAYPGTRRGLEPEWENFTAKHPDYREIIPLLMPAIERGIEWRVASGAANSFAPPWKNFKTWINGKCWTDEFPAVTPGAPKPIFGQQPPPSREKLEKNMELALSGMKGLPQ